MGHVKLSPCVVEGGQTTAFSRKMNNFSLSVDNLVNKNALTSNLRKKLSKCFGRSVMNVNFFKLFFCTIFHELLRHKKKEIGLT